MCCLLYSQKYNTGLTYGTKMYTNRDPDGAASDQQIDTHWRKNRNTPNSGGGLSEIGVDMNRNFHFLWDFHKYYILALHRERHLTLATVPDISRLGNLSEPESINLASVFDQFPNLYWYIDIHSTAEDMLYSCVDDDDENKR
ncbi:hypothetical protein NHQ30_002124 [Ciborinia camelliae]|nr:hypothetical protein NHQ30_002124 [Ciborinia camelliae]